jgi:hypothetical protein
VEQKLDNLLNLNTKRYKQASFTQTLKLDKHNCKKSINKVLKLGFNYAIEKLTKLCIQDLIIDTENTTGHFDNNILITLACKKNSNTTKLFTQNTVTYNKTNL